MVWKAGSVSNSPDEDTLGPTAVSSWKHPPGPNLLVGRGQRGHRVQRKPKKDLL